MDDKNEINLPSAPRRARYVELFVTTVPTASCVTLREALRDSAPMRVAGSRRFRAPIPHNRKYLVSGGDEVKSYRIYVVGWLDELSNRVDT